MIRKRRLAALVALCALAAPGTWLRSEISETLPTQFTVEQVAGASATSDPAWRVEGVWDYRAGGEDGEDSQGKFFGGFSAILPLGENTLRVFSDRGVRFTFTVPDQPAKDRPRPVTRQLVEPKLMYELWDIESATRDPETGTYWLGYEFRHAIHRFTVASEGDGMVALDSVEPELDWYANGGLEAMERLSDGRFFALGERQDYALVWPGDPVEGGQPVRVPFENPVPDFAASDMAELPDGRVLVLMRQPVLWVPHFEALLLIGEPPAPGSQEAFTPEIALRLDDVIPADNYEGLAVREAEDGEVIVWILADNNFSILQRNLLAKLVFDPS